MISLYLSGSFWDISVRWSQRFPIASRGSLFFFEIIFEWKRFFCLFWFSFFSSEMLIARKKVCSITVFSVFYILPHDFSFYAFFLFIFYILYFNFQFFLRFTISVFITSFPFSIIVSLVYLSCFCFLSFLPSFLWCCLIFSFLSFYTFPLSFHPFFFHIKLFLLSITFFSLFLSFHFLPFSHYLSLLFL